MARSVFRGALRHTEDMPLFPNETEQLPANEQKCPIYLINTVRNSQWRAQTKQLEGKTASQASELEGKSVLLAELREEEARVQLQVRSLQSSLQESVAQVIWTSRLECSCSWWCWYSSATFHAFPCITKKMFCFA